jgi:hypothetical protein
MIRTDPNLWAHLSQPEWSGDCEPSDLIRRAIGRLGEYTEFIIRPMNMRPTAATLLCADANRIEVRVSSATSHVVLVIGADADIAGELFWLKALAPRRLPIAHVIAHDLSNTTVPFAYMVLGYASGMPLAQVEDAARVRVAARQIGRAMRRVHQTPAPGFGRPAPNGRWLQADWYAALSGWLEASGAIQAAEQYLGADTLPLLVEATIDHADLACQQARVLHGQVGPVCALVTTGESVQLEAIVRPGRIVAGDPLFDVAHALLPHHPPAFRSGFLEGYAALGPLDPQQRLALRRYGLLALLARAGQAPAPEDAELIPSVIDAELELLLA